MDQNNNTEQKVQELADQKKETGEQKIRRIVKEELQSAFDRSLLPKGHERCPVCSELKKIGEECLYCKKRVDGDQVKDDEDLFEEIGL